MKNMNLKYIWDEYITDVYWQTNFMLILAIIFQLIAVVFTILDFIQMQEYYDWLNSRLGK